MKRECLYWLADKPRFTRRFALRIGPSCRVATVVDVAEEFHLDWHAVKELGKEYLREPLTSRVALSRVIGINEISIGKGRAGAPKSRVF